MIPALEPAVERRLASLQTAGVIQRLWQKDPTLWNAEATTPEVTDRLGWLTAPSWMMGRLDRVSRFADEVRREFERVVLLGMGGSSFAPELFARTMARRTGFPTFVMLDSTHPKAVQQVEREGDLARTLFIVSSKSGTTLETISLYEYFWERAERRGSQFVAITDGGSELETLGNERGFRDVFTNPSDIGGRYSALSYFGMVPAAAVGVDVADVMRRAKAMADACSNDMPINDNPGAWLGAAMGEAAVAGRDKLILVLSPRLEPFGLWAEQLVAESTGKEGKGIVPVAQEPWGMQDVDANDRLFVTMAQAGTRESGMQVEFRTLEDAGHPVLRLSIADSLDLGAEMFKWEFATAVVGAILGVNPFDQPNVAESKQITARVLREGGVGDLPVAGQPEIEDFLGRVRPGHYVAIMAYASPSLDTDRRLAGLQAAFRDRVNATVTVGYGPRLLHSTGQLHKGGPPTGHFVQIVEQSDADVAVPGVGYTFGELIAAQAFGDYRALHTLGRPIIRVTSIDQLEAVR